MDISTIFAVQGGLLVISAATMFINWRINPTLPESRYWAISSLLMVVAAFILSVFVVEENQSTLFDRIILISGNTTYALGFLMILNGALCAVDRKALSFNQVAIITVILGAAQLVSEVDVANVHIWRPAISTTGLCLISIATIHVMLFSSGTITYSRAMLATFSSLAAIMLALRSVLLFLWIFGWETSDFIIHILPYYVLTLIVAGFTITFIMMTTQKLHRKLRDQAERDPLTGVFNRRAFYNTSELMVANARRDNKSIAIAMFDLDLFKQVNDKYGHSVGDEVLKLFVKTASQSLRAGDLFVRFGGEEFIALLISDDPSGSAAITERIRIAFGEQTLEFNGLNIKTTVSVGICNWLDTDNIVDKVIQRADEALYHAKKSGRNCYVIYDDKKQ